jgi:hypothetical protein
MFKHTSREANKEATPIGMKIMLISRNAEITCRERGRDLLIIFSMQTDNIREILETSNYKAYPSWCENWLACWKFLLSKLRI